MKQPRLAIFDMDGLLFDTERLFMNKKGEVMKDYGLIQKEDDYKKTIGTAGETLSRILREIYGPDYPEEEITDRTREAVNQHIKTHGLPVKPGIPKLLATLKKNGIPCCIATSSPAAVAASYVRQAGLDGYFSFLIGGDEITHSKPDPEIFLTACRKADTAPADALVFEDSENGVLAASRGGIPVICIPDLKQPDPEIARKAAAVCRSANEVPDLLHLN